MKRRRTASLREATAADMGFSRFTRNPVSPNRAAGRTSVRIRRTVISLIGFRMPLARIVGQSGIDTMTRVFGFLLIAIGMQFLLTGVSDFYRIPHI